MHQETDYLFPISQPITHGHLGRSDRRERSRQPSCVTSRASPKAAERFGGLGLGGVRGCAVKRPCCFFFSQKKTCEHCLTLVFKSSFHSCIWGLVAYAGLIPAPCEHRSLSRFQPSSESHNSSFDRPGTRLFTMSCPVCPNSFVLGQDLSRYLFAWASNALYSSALIFPS